MKYTDMDTDDFLKDDFLADLLSKVPLDSPSEGFVNKVMAGIEPLPQAAEEKRPYFVWLKSSAPYIFLGIALAFIIYSSDIPYLNFIYGKEYFAGLFVKTFGPFWISLKTLLASKFITYTLLISVSAGFLFIIDKLFSRRFAA